MGTPSYIAKQIGDDAYLTIYCHLDGHLHSTGALLAEHYSTAQQVDALLALGDIYCLGSKMNPDADYPHDIEHGTQKDVTVAYARDYGETGYDASVMDIDEMLDGENSVEYLYIFTQDNRWKYLACCTEEMELKDVAEVLQAEEQQVNDPDDPNAWLKAQLRKFLVSEDAVPDIGEAPPLQI